MGTMTGSIPSDVPEACQPRTCEFHLLGWQRKRDLVGKQETDVAHELPVLGASERLPTQLSEFVCCERVATGRKTTVHDPSSRDDIWHRGWRNLSRQDLRAFGRRGRTFSRHGANKMS